MGLRKIFLLFMVYSFDGWIAETIYCSIRRGSFVKRGFLKGPLCPIYGFGALSVIVLLKRYHSNPILLFFTSIILTGIIEYITSYGLERLFNVRLWGYSHRKFNINGRVCLRNALMFGVLSIVLIRFIHPITERIISKISDKQLKFISKISSLYLIIDTTITVANTLNIDLAMKGFLNLGFGL